MSDEGMWIPLFLDELNEKEMQSMGMKISAEDIYSINHSSLKDAIVIFGRGCTAEIISDEGLILTNHHCGYGLIQRHSSLEHDYLTDGFWAMDKQEELSNPGLTVTLLVRMEDVTKRVFEGITDDLSEAKRDSIIKSHIEVIEKEAVDTTHYKAKVKSFFYGNQFILFVNEVFEDVRLAGAPPSNIGKFGGDTDNWMWPRHTGDFSIFRIYVDSNNMPAKYSKNNVPYKPKAHIPISLKGVEEDDFTFVFGYPGSTQKYISSFAVKSLCEVKNPVRIRLREKRIDVMNRYMNNSDLVRIQYSGKLAGVANGWKKWIGENRGIVRLDAIDKKREQENEFQQWTNSNQERVDKYGNLFAAFKETYGQLEPLELSLTYLFEAGLGIEIVNYSLGFRRLLEASKQKNGKEQIRDLVDRYKNREEKHFKDYHMPIDKEVFIALLEEYYSNLDKAYLPDIFNTIEKKFKSDFSLYADYVYRESIFASKEKTNKFLNNYTLSKYKKIEKDPAYKLAISIYGEFINDIKPHIIRLKSKLDSLQRIYMQGLMEFQPDKRFYPEANFTLRVAYGKVRDYYPRDAVHYDYFTTLEGIMEKEDPDIYDYVVEDKLGELYNNKDYGQYADKDGSMHVCFIATNHTTGGNSGSPILNAEGQLVGINFDRNWEGTMSDIIYDPDQCRNIALDIRYCLFIIDKYAGAGHLIEEMTIVK